MEFERRRYRRLGPLIADLRAVWAARQEVTAATRGRVLNAAFRERLMLAVTAVNGCRYCSYGHTRMALAAGVPIEQVQALLAGTLGACPPEEAPALLYAQHWAESDGKPAPEARARIAQTYGAQQARVIEAALQVIRIGNLVGNSWDHVLWRLSRGRWGSARWPRPHGAQDPHLAAGGRI